MNLAKKLHLPTESEYVGSDLETNMFVVGFGFAMLFLAGIAVWGAYNVLQCMSK